MSYYSSGDVATIYHDPKSFIDGNRAVFELEGHHLAYLPNMRLLNNGVFGSASAYADLIGADGIIKDIVLYDGRTELTRLKKFGNFRGFVNQNQSNSKAMSLRSPKSATKLGYLVDNANKLAVFQGNAVATTVARAATGNSFLDLRECLPMLNSLTHLPSDIFANLRLEITYNIELSSQILEDITDAITGMSIPTLAVDVLDDETIVNKMNKNLGNIEWLEIESDQVFFPQSVNDGGGADQGLEQELNVRLDGFKGKSVERMVMVKELADKLSYLSGNNVLGFGKYGSVALYEEKIQVRLNGSNIFPKSGLEGNMERLGYLVDTFGECLGMPGFNQLDIDTGIVFGASAADGRFYAGQLAYNAWYLGDRVYDLQVVHSRVGLNDTTLFRPTTEALNVIYFAEVKKALVLNKNGYNVIYV